MRCMLSCVAVAFLLTTNAWCQTKEEACVRIAYARLAFASQLHGASSLIRDAWMRQDPDINQRFINKVMGESALTFTLADFKFGPVSEIMNQPAASLMTIPTNWRLQVSYNTHNLQEEDKKSNYIEADVEWHPVGNEWPAAVQNISLAYAYLYNQRSSTKTPIDKAFSTYASYNVTLSYQGRTIGPYKALFLFGKDASGFDHTSPYDLFVGSMELGQAMATNLYPSTFLESSMRNLKMTSYWLRESSAVSCSGFTSLADAMMADGVCCDPMTMKCGLSEDHVQQSLAKPTAPLEWLKKGSARQWVWADCSDDDCGDSPIVIDTDGSGFRLTSLAHGVNFDMAGTGTRQKISWTAAGSTNALLALDPQRERHN
jgi:hypothetical protein